MKNKIIVIGAGAWGTALANLLAQNSSAKEFDVCLIANKKEIVDEINQQHSNHNFLPNINLSYNLKSSQNLEEEALGADFIFVVTPSTATTELLQKIAQFNLKTNCGLVICSKGLETSSLKFFHQIIEEILPKKNYAILSGPNFAAEVASEAPTITTIASQKPEFAKKVVDLLNNKYFKAEISQDVVATEICAIIKNIMAIGCGIVDGLGLGQNTKAALVTQGITEIKILCQKFDSKGYFNNAAGFGDIFLTCASAKSRNNSLGSMVAKGQKSNIDNNKTYEGAIGAQAISLLAEKLHAELPLCKIINYILQNNLTQSEIKSLIIGSIL
jgi:glycerol-3-phosphate dehydrogenase (NAD(P)+)